MKQELVFASAESILMRGEQPTIDKIMKSTGLDVDDVCANCKSGGAMSRQLLASTITLFLFQDCLNPSAVPLAGFGNRPSKRLKPGCVLILER